MEELIDRYFGRALSDDEQQQLGLLLEKDEAFRKEWEFRLQLQAAIQHKERTALKDMVAGFEQSRRKPYHKIAFAAASLIIVAGFVAWLLLSGRPDGEKLYLAYFEPFPNTVMPSVRGSNGVSPAYEAFRMYEAGNYPIAATLFANIRLKESSDYAVFYEGISYMASGEDDKAVALFELHTLKDGKTPFESYRKWYLALIYLRQGREEKALSLLKTLDTPGGPVQKTAAELLRKLE